MNLLERYIIVFILFLKFFIIDSLRNYGRQLPSFLQKMSLYSAIPALAELAEFEWSLGDAFDAANEPVLQPQTISAIPPQDWPSLQLHFHASVRTLHLRWNIPGLWNAFMNNTPPPRLQQHTQSVLWLIWRKDLKTRFRSVDLLETSAFELAMKGNCFSDIFLSGGGD